MRFMLRSSSACDMLSMALAFNCLRNILVTVIAHALAAVLRVADGFLLGSLCEFGEFSTGTGGG